MVAALHRRPDPARHAQHGWQRQQGQSDLLPHRRQLQRDGGGGHEWRQLAGGQAVPYDAYGKVTVCSPNGNAIGGNASQVGNTILYAGETFDSSTGLYYDRTDTTTRSWAGSLARSNGHRRQRQQPVCLLRRQPHGCDGPKRFCPAKPFEYVPGGLTFVASTGIRLGTSERLQGRRAI